MSLKPLRQSLAQKTDNDNRAYEWSEEKKEPISTLHQASAFKGSGGNSQIRRLNSLKTFDDQPLLAVIA